MYSSTLHRKEPHNATKCKVTKQKLHNYSWIGQPFIEVCTYFNTTNGFFENILSH